VEGVVLRDVRLHLGEHSLHSVNTADVRAGVDKCKGAPWLRPRRRVEQLQALVGGARLLSLKSLKE
jgi:hypothetical protein